MNKIAIVCDSSISLTKQEVIDYDVYIVPNIIMHNNQTYLDQVTISNQEVIDLLHKKEKITTSQPNIGTMIETFDKIKANDYDYTIIISIASSLSGGYNAFNQAAKQAKLENYTVVDSHTLAGPVQQGVKAIRKLSEDGKDINEIITFLEKLFQNQTSFLYPNSLDEIVASGRVSRPAAMIASLLKIKAVLYFNEKSTSIDRLGIARTDKKIFETIIKHFQKYHINPKTYDLYFLESGATDQVEKLKTQIFDKLGEFNYYIRNLPPALSVHAGSQAIVVQWCLKIPE